MEAILKISKEERIARRRDRIKKKLQEQNNETTSVEPEYAITTRINNEETKEKEVSTIDKESSTKEENNQLEQNVKNQLNKKKRECLEELYNEFTKEEKLFLDDIKKYEIRDDSSTYDDVKNSVDDSLVEKKKELYKFDSNKDFVELHNLSLKEKESYHKKIEKYFCLLKDKDEQIQKMCQINSQNFSSFINIMKNQMEGYKVYLGDIINKTRDSLNSKRRHLLNENRKILEDFLKLEKLNSFNIAKEIIEDERKMKERLNEQKEKNHLSLKLKNEYLEKNLKVNIQYVKEISHIFLDKEKNLYDGKILQQKNKHNLKMINFYKLEINKLRQALLSVKTYYYNYKMKSKKVINELINQYERIKFQFIELQTRQKNYETNFQKKYVTAWKLQKNEANKHIEKLISADRIIQEQIFLKKVYETNHKQLLDENSLHVFHDKEEEQEKPVENEKKITEEQIENVKKLLLQECTFLVEDEETKDDDEKLDKILKCIGVHDENNLKLLTQLFYYDEEIEEENDMKENGKIKKTKCSCINGEYVLDIISKYYKEKEKENLCKITKNKQNYTNRLNISIKLIIERKKKEREFWNQLSQVITDDMIQTWKTMLIFVEKYFTILKERSTIIESIFKEEKICNENLNKINKLNEMKEKL